MKLAVSLETNNGLDSVVAQHFGRCPYFAFIEVEGQEIRDMSIVPNPYYGHHQPGQVPDFIRKQGADVMLSGGMGGRAIGFFEQHGIQTATGAQGTLKQTLDAYFGGELSVAAPCADSIEHGHG